MHHSTFAEVGDRGRFITPEQATSISQAVKSIAMALGKKSGRNEFGAVGGADSAWRVLPQIRHPQKTPRRLYRELPARRFDEAVRFLTEWYQTLTGEGLPF